MRFKSELHHQAELEKAIKEKVVERRKTVFEKTKEEVAKRVKFEDAVSVMYTCRMALAEAIFYSRALS